MAGSRGIAAVPGAGQESAGPAAPPAQPVGLLEPQDVPGVAIRGQPVLAFGAGEPVGFPPQLPDRLDDPPAGGQLTKLAELAGSAPHSARQPGRAAWPAPP